jgi:hypothetical protein
VSCTPTTSPPPAGQPEAILARPLPRLYQRFVYHQDGLPAQGVSAGVIDRVVLRQRDADDNPETGPDGLEETLYYIQNSRGDVMQVIKPIAGPSDEWWNDDRGGYAVESVRYSPYGVPTAIVSADRRAQADHGSTGAAAHPRHGPACGRGSCPACFAGADADSVARG